ncbi:MAG: insulinase family protein, partial [Zoogloea sp.]|nr:insulinase family protein [Zoogloea sp.]
MRLRFVGMKFWLALLLAGVANLAAAAVNLQHWTTPAGVRVFYVEGHSLPIVDVQVDFAAGGAYAPDGKMGVAGLTHGLLDAGAGDLDEDAIANRLADVGAQLGGGADLDRASINLRTLSSREERDAAVGLMAQVIQQPTFPEAAFEREKARTIAELREGDTQPDAVLGKRFAALVFPGHPYGRQPLVETVGGLKRDDVLAFYRANYTARRAVVSIVGDVSRAEAEAIAERLTSGLPVGEVPAALPEERMPAEVVERVPNPSAQAHIALGMPGMRRGDPDFFPLVVGNYVLGGGGFVSRLTREVREKRGYAYSVYSYFQPMLRPGAFQIGLQTKGSQTDEALKVVRETLAEFLEKGPTQAELRAA